MAEVKKEEVKKTLIDYTLEELVHDMGNIQPKNLFSRDIQDEETAQITTTSLNLTWTQVIRAVNFAAHDKVLSWKSTGKQALEAMGRFLA